MEPETVLEAKVVCGQKRASCICKLDSHDPTTPHECSDVENCNGSWKIDADGTFHIIRYPGIDRVR